MMSTQEAQETIISIITIVEETERENQRKTELRIFHPLSLFREMKDV